MSKALPFATTLEARDNCLCLHTQRAARVLSRRFDRALRPAGLTNQQFSLLMALNRPAPVALGPVAHLLGMDRTTLTAALKPLDRKGLLTMVVDPADRRSRLLDLTDEGRRILHDALPIWRATQRQMEAALPPQGAETLRGMLAAFA